jgi:beta-mannanase
MCAAVTQGISAIYALENTTVTNAVVQSYTNDGEFNAEATIVNEEGLTIAWRGDDRKTQITCELIAKTSAMPELGAAFTVTINTEASYTSGSASTTFTGWVTKISCKGSVKNYSSVTVTAVGYEAVV